VEINEKGKMTRTKERDIQQQQSTTNNKGKAKEMNEYETVIEVPTENTPLLKK
jgi:hypothetical protein